MAFSPQGLGSTSWVLVADLFGDLLGWGFVLLVGFIFVVAFAVFAALISVGKLWFQALMSGARVGLIDLVAMRFRKVSPAQIVKARIMSHQAGIEITGEGGVRTQHLEAHYLAGGNVERVIQAIIAAERANLDLDFDRAAAIDLAGRNVLEAVTTSVYPRVIECPDASFTEKTNLSAISKDGIELRVRARVTVRTNLDQLIGGATEETIIARVGEGIITSIGSAETYLEVMEKPDLISKAVLDRALDSNTAFEIVSIDIADIDIGDNIGARLQADQADADTRVAQALAEKRRAEAVATEQENRAKVVANKALLVDAEALVPAAMAQAFSDGNLGEFDHSDMFDD
ncbi:MAG: flotillin-like protein FloA [Mariniblastus sp.]|nr:flotillin-like protein FloA [Mariniblastus sp.]